MALPDVPQEPASTDLRRMIADLRERAERAEREVADLRQATKDAFEHVALADQIVNEAINEAAGAVMGMPDGKPGDRVAAVVEKLGRLEAAESRVGMLTNRVKELEDELAALRQRG